MIRRYYFKGLLFFVDNDVYCKFFCKLREFTQEDFYDDNFKTDLFLSFIDKLFFFFNKLLCDNMFFYFFFISKEQSLNFSLYFSLFIVILFVSYLLFDFFSSFLLLFIKTSLLFFLLLQFIELKSTNFYF